MEKKRVWTLKLCQKCSVWYSFPMSHSSPGESVTRRSAHTHTEKVSTVLMKLDDDGVEGNYKLQENVCMCVRACTFNMCVCVSIIKKERNASPSPSHLLLYSSVFWWPWQPADEKILGVHLIEAMGRHEVRTDWKDSGMEREQDEGRGLAEWTLCLLSYFQRVGKKCHSLWLTLPYTFLFFWNDASALRPSSKSAIIAGHI